MAAIRIFLAVLTVAMSKSFHGLGAAVHEHLSQTPRAQFRAPLASLPALTYWDNRTPLARGGIAAVIGLTVRFASSAEVSRLRCGPHRSSHVYVRA